MEMTCDKSWQNGVVARVLAIAMLCLAANASAESPDGWRSMGAEVKVFRSDRDDGRAVGVYARPAAKGAEAGMLVRVTLAGFRDKSLAIREEDVPELFADYKSVATRSSFNPPIFFPHVPPVQPGGRPLISPFGPSCEDVEKVLMCASDFQIMFVTMVFDDLSTRIAGMAIVENTKAVIAAAGSGASLTQRFASALGRTVEGVPSRSRGAVVRAYHTALIKSGAK